MSDTTSELRPQVTKLVTDMTVARILSEEFLIDKLLELLAAQKQRWEAEARKDERQLALSELDADNQIQKRDFDLPRDFLDGWQDAIDTAAKQRDDRIAALDGVIGEPLDGLETPSEPAK